MRHGCHDRRNESPRKTGKAASGSIRTALRTNRTSVERSPHTNRITAERKTPLTGRRGDKTHRSPTILRSDRFRTTSSPVCPFRTGQPRSRPFRPSLIIGHRRNGSHERPFAGHHTGAFRKPCPTGSRRPEQSGVGAEEKRTRKNGRGCGIPQPLPKTNRWTGPLYIALIRATGATDMSANSPRWYLK